VPDCIPTIDSYDFYFSLKIDMYKIDKVNRALSGWSYSELSRVVSPLVSFGPLKAL
jgi:hypothetical protein